ncbi:hypothetical protein FHG87_018437 [Trinorchestia longiramus]|nr:hypothetical protein FHG87_018437 [Trinorchestia longiramus]
MTWGRLCGAAERHYVKWRGPLVALFYGVTSAAMAFINKAVLSTYDFNYPFLIMTLQVIITSVVLHSLLIMTLQVIITSVV